MIYPGIPLRTMLPHLLASIFYLHNLTFGDVSTINFVTWSLEIEVQFYLIAPIIGMLYAIRSRTVRRSTMVLLMIACGSFHLLQNQHMFYTIFNFGHYFLAGFLLADLMAELGSRQSTTKLRQWAWDAVSLVGWPIIFLLPPVDTSKQWLPFLILPIYLAAFYGPISNRVFRTEWVALLGGMCYSYYLMHMLVVASMFKLTKHLVRFDDFLLNYMVQLITLGACICVVATLYFILIERPCMDPQWPQKLWHRFFPLHSEKTTA